MRRHWKERIEGLERRIVRNKRETIFARKEFGYEEVDYGNGKFDWRAKQFEGSLREQFIALMRHLKLKAERKEGKIKVVPRKEFQPVFYCSGMVDVKAARESLKKCLAKLHTTKEFPFLNRGATDGPQFLRRKRERVMKDVSRIHVHVYEVKETMVEVDFVTADMTPAEARDVAIQTVKQKQNVNLPVPADNKYVAVSFVLGEEHQYEDINAIKD